MPQDLLLYNGAVCTMDPRHPRAEAVLLRGERILAVGDTATLRGLAGPGAKHLHLQGRTVLPGFADAHVHFTMFGLTLQRVNLAGVATLEEGLARVQARLAEVPTGEWLLGGGWNHNTWAAPLRPTRHDLDRIAPTVPVALASKDVHSLWVNSVALRAAGITAATPEVAGGQILRDAHGEPNGIFTEKAQALIQRAIPPPGPAATLAAARAALGEAARFGVTSLHNCEGPEAFAALARLAEEEALTARVWQMIPLTRLGEALALGLRTGYGNDHLRVGQVKMFADGALGSLTAEMLAPFEDYPGVYGVAATTTEELEDGVRRAAAGGLASAIHAIGDGANRRVLDIFARMRAAGVGAGLRHRIEHVQLLAPEDLPRLAQLGIIASMQPIHATQDMAMADLHWGKRARWGYAWKSLLQRGTLLILGTDCPVEALAPLPNVYAAVTRKRPDRTPVGGWYAEERLTLDEALYGYTQAPALASGEAAQKGSLTPGKLADLVVLSRDIHAAPAEALLDTTVALTLLGGRVIYEQ